MSRGRVRPVRSLYSCYPYLPLPLHPCTFVLTKARVKIQVVLSEIQGRRAEVESESSAVSHLVLTFSYAGEPVTQTSPWGIFAVSPRNAFASHPQLMAPSLLCNAWRAPHTVVYFFYTAGSRNEFGCCGYTLKMMKRGPKSLKSRFDPKVKSSNMGLSIIPRQFSKRPTLFRDILSH